MFPPSVWRTSLRLPNCALARLKEPPQMNRTSVLPDPLRGIALSLGATVLFATSDITAKFLTAHLPVIEIAWIRYVVFVAIAGWLATRAAPQGVWPRSLPLQVARGICLVGSAVLFVFGLRYLKIAEATTISFVSPLLITVLSIPLLGEQVGIRRWGAVIAGMIGVITVMRPGLGGFHPAALYALGSAACWATALVITRRMAGTERPATTLLWSAASGLLVLTLLLPLGITLPTGRQLALAVGLGVLASCGQWMVVLAHRHAPASVLAPFSYAQLIWATFYGWLVFNALPDRWTLAGGAIIIASGLYTAHRERLLARAERRGRRLGGAAAVPAAAYSLPGSGQSLVVAARARHPLQDRLHVGMNLARVRFPRRNQRTFRR